MTQRYFIELSFKGTNYHGWQIQKNAHSVQQELNEALSVLLNQKIETLGCGRTDTGVHAKQFFAHFDVSWKDVKSTKESNPQSQLPVDFLYHLNCLLSFDISIKKIFPVANDANARFDATSRTYEYILYNEKNPFLRDFACFFPFELNVDKMNEAAQLLLEYEDYSCFSKTRTQVKTNLCKIISAEWITGEELKRKKEKGKMENNTLPITHYSPVLIFEITANRFLRGMVRAIVGTMVELGRERITINDFRKIIENKNRSAAGASVPACGLYLTKIEYKFN